MNILETKDLCKKYKEFYALHNVNMHIEQGDVYGFVGENGAGKTTLIRVITGLASASEGDYALFGIKNDDKGIIDQRKNISAIVEAPSIFPAFTAKQNLKLQATIKNIKISDKECEDLLNKVGLAARFIENKKAKDFSLGMRQRLGIAIALIDNPKFIVLDEPMNGLDPQGFIEIRNLIKELNNEGITFLISSHILGELEKVCNRIGFLSHGKLIKEISTEELRNVTGKRIEIESNDISPIKVELENTLSLKEVILLNNKLIIKDNIDINDVMSLLVTKGFKVTSLTTRSESIEEYYIDLMKEVNKNA